MSLPAELAVIPVSLGSFQSLTLFHPFNTSIPKQMAFHFGTCHSRTIRHRTMILSVLRWTVAGSWNETLCLIGAT